MKHVLKALPLAAFVVVASAVSAWGANEFTPASGDAQATLVFDTSANTPYAFDAETWNAARTAGKVTVALSAKFDIESDTTSYTVATVPTDAIENAPAASDFTAGENACATGNAAVDGIAFAVEEDTANSLYKISITRKSYVWAKSGHDGADVRTTSTWSNNKAMSGGNDYIVYGNRRVHPYGSSANYDYTVPSDSSLTLANGWDGSTDSSQWGLNFYHYHKTFTATPLILSDWGMAIFDAAKSSGVTQKLSGTIKAVASQDKPAIIGVHGSRVPEIESAISGSGALMVAPWTEDGSALARVTISGDNTSFTGTWYIHYSLLQSSLPSSIADNQMGAVIFENGDAIGNHPDTLVEKSVVFNGGALYASQDIDLTTNPNRGFYFEGNSKFVVTTGNTLKLGTTLTGASNVTVTKTDKGTLDLTKAKLAGGLKLSVSGGTVVIGEDFAAEEGTTLHFGSSGLLSVPLATSGNGVVIDGKVTATSTLTITNGVSELETEQTYVLFSVPADSESVAVDKIKVVGGDWWVAATSVTTDTVQIGGKDYLRYLVSFGPAQGVYVWNGASGGLWGEASNWLVNGEVPATAPPSDAAYVLIPQSEAESLTIWGAGLHPAATNYLGHLKIARDVTLQGNLRVTYGTESGAGITGSHQLTLENVDLHADSEFHIYPDLKVSGTVNNASISRWYIHGELTGNASSLISNNHYSGTSYNGTTFYGACTNFFGSFTGGSRYSQNRDHTHFQNGDSTSAGASWSFGSYEGNKMYYTDGDTYRFGCFTTRGSFNVGNGSAWPQNTTTEIGALNLDSTLTAGDFGEGKNNSLRKVGSASLTLNAKNISRLYLAGGSVTLSGTGVPESLELEADDTVLEVMNSAALNTLNSVTGNGHDLTLDVGKRVQLHVSDSWAGVTDFTKTGTGTIVFSVAPAWTGTLTVEGGAVTVPLGTELTIDPSKCYIDKERTDRIVVRPYDATLVWCGKGANDRLDNVDNWRCDNKELSELDEPMYEVPLDGEKAIHLLFPEDDAGYTVTLPRADSFATMLTINAHVTFNGKGILKAGDFDGFGSVSLDETAGLGTTGSNIDCYYDIEVTGTNQLYTYVGALYYHGSLSGDGVVDLTTYNHNGSISLDGDNSEFAGTLNATNSFKIYIFGSESGSANATWNIDSYVFKANKGDNTIVGTTVEFGEFHGSVTRQHYSLRSASGTYVIGALGTDSDISGALAATDNNHANRADSIRKVGEGVLTSTATRAYGYYVDEGTLYLASEPSMYSSGFVTFNGGVLRLDPSVTTDLSGKIKNSTAALKIETIDPEQNVTWANAISANNTVSEIEKYGEGTLTLSKSPAWTSTTVTVDAGYVVIPSTMSYALGTNTKVDETYVDATGATIRLVHYDVAQVGETIYGTIDDAYAAATNSDEIVYLIHNSNYALNIPLSGAVQIVNTNNFTWAGVNWPNGSEHLITTTGTIEVDGVQYDVVRYEAYDNSASSWTGSAGDGLWATGGNWSTGYIPNEFTRATFVDDAEVSLGDAATRVAGSIVANAGVTLCANGTDNASSATLRVSDGMSGTGSLTFANGTIAFDTATEFGCAMSVAEGASVVVSASDCDATSAASLAGEGRIVFDGVLPGSGLAALLQDAAWTGAAAFSNFDSDGALATTAVSLDTYGNSGSTVAFDNATANLSYGTHNVGTVEISSGGLTLVGADSNSSWTLSGALTGAGTLTLAKNGTYAQNLILTGDCSGFTGAIAFATDATPRVVFGNSADGITVASRVIIVSTAANGATCGAAWTADAIYVNNDLAVKTAGSLAGAVYGTAAGTITYESIPASAPSFASTWAGTVILPATTGTATVPLADLGVSGSTIVVNGISGTSANAIKLASADTVAATLKLDGDMTLTDGTDSAAYTFAELTGNGNLTLSIAAGSAASATYTITKTTNYGGILDVQSSNGHALSATIGTIAVDEATANSPLVRLTSTSSVTGYNNTAVVENGTTLSGIELVKELDGLYIASVSVTVDSTTTKFGTYALGAAYAIENSVDVMNVLYGDGALDGWTYDDTAKTLTLNQNTARIVSTGEYYLSLTAAMAAANSTDTIVLFRNSSDSVTLSAGQTLQIDSGVTYSGTVSGSGTLRLADATATAPVANDWTGTVVAGWTISSGSAALAGLGNANSTIALGAAMTGGSLDATIASTLRLDADMTLTEGTSSATAWDGVATITQLSGSGNFTMYSPTGGNKSYYAVTTLDGAYSGTLAIGENSVLKIGSVSFSTTLETGSRAIAVTLADGGDICNADGTSATSGLGAIATTGANGAKLVYKADGTDGAGLYVAAFASVTTAGDETTTYTTLASAFENVSEGATITPLESTDESIAYSGEYNITVDLHGATWTSSAAATLTNSGTGKITIVDTAATPGTMANSNSEGFVAKSATGAIELTGGQFQGANTATLLAAETSGSVEVTGGAFIGWNPTTFVATGYTAYEDTAGVWTVDATRIFKLASDTETVYYYSARDAIENANGAVVVQQVAAVAENFTLGTDETLNISATSAQSLTGTIAMNGGTLVLADGFAATVSAISAAEGTSSAITLPGEFAWDAAVTLASAGEIAFGATLVSTSGPSLAMSGAGTLAISTSATTSASSAAATLNVTSGSIALTDGIALPEVAVTLASGVRIVVPAVTTSDTLTLMTAKTIANNGIVLDTSSSASSIDWGNETIVDNADGTQSLQISPKVYTVQHGETKYQTFAEAIEDISATTIDLSVILGTTEYVTVPSGTTLRISDPNEYFAGTISLADDTAAYMFKLEDPQITGAKTLSDGRPWYTDSRLDVPKNVEGATASFAVSGAGTKMNAYNELQIGIAKDSTGTVVVSDGAEMSVSTYIALGYGDDATATLEVDGATMTTAGKLFLNSHNGGKSGGGTNVVVSVKNGGVISAASIDTAYSAGANTHTKATLSGDGTGVIALASGNSQAINFGRADGAIGELAFDGVTVTNLYTFNLGAAQNATGVVTVAGGTIVSSGKLDVGQTQGTLGVWRQTGGFASFDSIQVGGSYLNGASSENLPAIATGRVEVVGGTLMAGSLSYGYSGNGVAIVTVGDGTGDDTATLVASNGVEFANTQTALSDKSESLTLRRGGILRAKFVRDRNDRVADEGSVVTFDGGTIAATEDETSFLQSNYGLAYRISSRGMVVDTDGHAVTINASNLSGASGVTAPKLTKTGAGVLTLTGECSGLVITVEAGAGVVKAPTGSYTLGSCTYVQSTDGSVDTLAYRLVATVGTRLFATIQAAVDYVMERDREETITLVADCDDAVTVPYRGKTEKFYLDLADYGFSGSLSAPSATEYDLSHTAPTAEGDTVHTYTLSMTETNYLWAGGASGNWTNAVNWTVGTSGVTATRAPEDTDEVTFGASEDAVTVTVDDGVSVELWGLYLTAPCSVTISGDGLVESWDTIVTVPSTYSETTDNALLSWTTDSPYWGIYTLTQSGTGYFLEETSTSLVLCAGNNLLTVKKSGSAIPCRATVQTVESAQKIKVRIGASDATYALDELSFWLNGREVTGGYEIEEDATDSTTVFWLTLAEPEVESIDFDGETLWFTVRDQGLGYAVAKGTGPESFVAPSGDSAWTYSGAESSGGTLTLEVPSPFESDEKAVYFKLYVTDGL